MLRYCRFAAIACIATTLAVCITGCGSSAARFRIAVYRGDVNTVRAYLHSDPSLARCVDDAGYTPIHDAAQAGYTQVVVELVKAGASLDAATPMGDTALHIAVTAGHMDTVLALIGLGANINRINNYYLTPLQCAIMRKNIDIARLLIDHGADVNATGNKLLRPLLIARKDPKMTALLKKAGAR